MKIYVVGIGAGSADGMTFEARNVLDIRCMQSL